MRHTSLRILVLVAPVLAMALTACGQSEGPASEAPVPWCRRPRRTTQRRKRRTQAAEEAKAAELAAKEQELANARLR